MRKSKLRRSRSWKDLSSFMSRRFFGGDHVPSTSPKRSSSLMSRGRGTTRSRLFYDFETEAINTNEISLDEQREKERAFQRKASIKRKMVPSRTPPAQTPPQQSHLPAFAFSTQTLQRPTKAIHTPSSSIKDARSVPLHSRSYSVSTTGHSRMASEMSVPMVFDFDLAKHQNSALFAPGGELDFGVNAPVEESELSFAEKAHLISHASPMHIVDIRRVGSKSSKPSPLKRIFSLRKSDNSTHTRQSSSSKSSVTSKQSRSEHSSPRNFPTPETTTTRSIYTRPAPIRKPPSPPLSGEKKDAPPRLTVQIPDSTMDRASKIFQSIYAAHAQAQEALGSQFGFPTPPTASPTSSRTGIRVIPDTKVEGFAATFTSDPRPAPLPKGSFAVGREIYVQKQPRASAEKGEFVVDDGVVVTKRVSAQFIATSKRGSVMLTSKRRVPSFPAPPERRPLTPPTTTASEEDEFDNDDDDEWEDDNPPWDRRTGAGLKEPVWEMLTPANRAKSLGITKVSQE